MVDGRHKGEALIATTAKVHLRLAQTFYLARMAELKSTIADCETRFVSLMTEIQAIKSGSLDESILAELRAVLARKYGKRLLDSWIPSGEDVREAVELGPQDQAEQADVEMLKTEREQVQEKEVNNHVAEVVSSTPASELSPPPSVLMETMEKPLPRVGSASPAIVEEPKSRPTKRKANQQPRGAPPTKKSGRRAVSPAPTQAESDVNSDKEAKDAIPIQPEQEPKTAEEPDPDGAELEPATGRARRISKRGPKKAVASPAPSARTKESSPAVSRRAPSVSSTTSATPAVPVQRGKRVMRDKVVSKSVREQSVAESVKEEVEDELDEGISGRSSRRSVLEERRDSRRVKRGSVRSE